MYFSNTHITLIITALFTAIGWGTTHIVDRLNSAPIVEFDETYYKNNTSTKHELIVTNLTSDKVFSNLEIAVHTEDELLSIIEKTNVNSDPPAWEGSSNGIISQSKKSVKFTIEKLHPRWTIHLITQYSGPGKFIVKIMSVGGDQSIYVMEKGATSFLVRNEIYMIALMIILWVIIICCIVIYSKIKLKADRTVSKIKNTNKEKF